MYGSTLYIAIDYGVKCLLKREPLRVCWDWKGQDVGENLCAIGMQKAAQCCRHGATEPICQTGLDGCQDVWL